MSITLIHAAADPVRGASTPITPIGFRRLVAIELRKMTDTRGGRWLLATIAAVSALAIGYTTIRAGSDPSFRGASNAAVSVAAFLAPVAGLLAMTSEWTQRTALTTFTLAPRRLPVFLAKLFDAVVLALAVLAVGLAMATAATAISGAVNGHADWSGFVADVRGGAVIVVCQVLMACAFGALAAQTTVALVAYFAAPAVWSAVAVALFGHLASWFDVFDAYGRLSSPNWTEHLGRSATSIALWVVAPTVIGIVRSLRRDVK
ncbi:MAG: hypothetical protein JWM34_5317 [Ilumatobacteraceae bacterium]|nr:hypothetical protein [Ilumatobacteraceae bacterium]